MKTKDKINILGTEVSILIKSAEDDAKLYNCSGYTDITNNKIIIKDISKYKNDVMSVEKPDVYMNKVLRHECIHQFFTQSGLDHMSENEELVDWLAFQFPKIYKAFKELGCLE